MVAVLLRFITALNARFSGYSIPHSINDHNTGTMFGIFDNQTEQISLTFLLLTAMLLPLALFGCGIGVCQGYAQFKRLAVTEDGDFRYFADSCLGNLPLEMGWVLDFAAVQGGDDIPLANTRLVGRATFNNIVDQSAFGLFQPE